jgi:hypothetical protein
MDKATQPSIERTPSLAGDLPTPGDIARGRAQPGSDEHQVWHLGGYPASRIAWAFGAFEPRFPQDYIHVANVQAASLDEAAALTTHAKGLVDGKLASWRSNPGTNALVMIPRSTDAGDVIVDPSGQAYRVERHGFGPVETIAEARPSPSGMVDDALSPSEIARQAAVEAANAMKTHIQGKPVEMDLERSGQLSPSHTPGRSGR